MAKYQAYTYDVWGNSGDGWNVNDVFRTSKVYELSSGMTDDQIIESLKKQGCFKKGVCKKLIYVDGDDETLYFEYKGKPEFELRRTIEEEQ